MFLRIVSLALMLILLSFPAVAEILTISLPIEENWDTGSPEGRWLSEVLASPNQDRSMRPKATWWYLLPEGRIITEARLRVSEESMEAAIAGEPQLLPTLEETGVAQALWPGEYLLDLSSPQRLHGQRLQGLTVLPLREEEGRLLALRGAELVLTLDDDTAVSDRVRPRRPDFPLAERILGVLGDRILNPGDLPADGRAVGGGGFPTDIPSIEGSVVDMVIVTADSLKAYCQSYAIERTNVGLPTVVRTMEWIEEHYPYGCDRSEMLRNFVRDAYEKWSIQYLFLVGDTDIVPARFAYSLLFVTPTTTPTDLYFSCLDGNWNADLDAYWGEVALNGDPGDDADLMPEVFVGRMPAGTLSECSILLDKARQAQNCASTTHQDRVLLLGEVLFPQDWEYGMEIYLDGGEYCESVAVNAIGPDHELLRLYENYYDFPGSNPLLRDDAFYAMDTGQGVVLHNGHGGRQTMSVGNGRITSSDVVDMANGTQTFMLYMVNCTAAAFDYNCLAESFLSAEGGGAYAVIGSTRDTFSNISVHYQNAFFYELYDNSDLRIGALYSHSLSQFIAEANQNTGYRWAHLTLALLGDPSSWVRYELPQTPDVTLPSSWETGSGPLLITVENESSQPWENALVTLRKDDEDYVRGLTDINGEVSLDLLPETEGNYKVRIDARGMDPWVAMLPVGMQNGESYLSIYSVTVDDLSDGTVFGNNNGVLEAGETVRLLLSLGNEGDTAALGVEATLASVHDSLAVIGAVDSFGDIGVGAFEPGAAGYLIHLGEVDDDEILPFTLQINNGDVDEFFLETAAYDLALYAADFDDDAGGDGDGIMEVGETAVLSIYLVNWGRGMASGVTATLEPAPGSGMGVATGPIAFGDIPGLAHDLGPLEYSVSRNTSDPTDLILILEDALARRDTLALSLERPSEMAVGPEFEFTSVADVIRLSWEPNPGSAFYRVERSDNSQSGPFISVNPDWMEFATYEDMGLDAYTSYWYRIIPLSLSLIPGDPSPVAQVKTQPALKDGWPQLLEWETPSTPVLIDVDGDGALEIFVGSDELYGYYADGRELSDGDNNSMTHGPLSTEGQKFFAALAAGDLIRGGVPSVVGASWDTHEVYVWQLEDQGDEISASVAPGWPQPVISTSGIWAAPALADVTGDGDLNIFVVDLQSNLYGWHADGTEIIDGDNNPSTPGVFDTGLGSWSRATPAFADINRDGVMEIFVACANGEIRGYWGDGTPLPGFPFVFSGTTYSGISTGDIDADGWPELVFQSTNDSTYVINHNGSRMAGWPIHLTYNNYNYWLAPTAALVDIEGDSKLEIFLTSMINGDTVDLGWLDSNGSWLPGWPMQTDSPSQASPVVGDIDGDGDMETLLPNENGQIECWHHDGSPAAGFPIIITDSARASTTLADIDGDGYLDMLHAGWDKFVYVWDFGTEYNAEALPWYTYGHDQLRSGREQGGDWILGEEVGVGDELPQGMVSLDANWPNPFNPSTQMQFSIGEGGMSGVRLSIHDARGRRLVMLVDEPLESGTYLRSWDGRDQQGRSLPSGIYFARLQVDEKVQTRKMMMIK